MTQHVDLPALAFGERVQHELLVRERSERKTGKGDTFAILTLGNASGIIETAPIWSDKLHWADGALPGAIVQVVGEIRLYQGKRQLEVTAPVRVLPKELFVPERFLPTISRDTVKLWELLDKLRTGVTTPRLRAVLDLFFRDDDFRVRFERAPGSTGGHHAQIGGLLLHVWEVTRIAKEIAKTMNANVDLVVTGAMLHDIGKVESYEIAPTGFGFTPCGLLLGHVVMGSLMLERRLAALDESVCSEGQLLELQHLILSHHGSLEFGSPVQPMTVEAEIVHWADESSAKAADLADVIADDDQFPEGAAFTPRSHWRVRKKLWRRPAELWAEGE